MDGVREDVVTILLNLKKLRFEMLTSEAQTVTISAKGPKKVSGGDLSVPGQVRLLNPNSYICELTDKNATFEAEFRIERGLGYVPREAFKKDRVEIGEISVDAIFSPIRRVNYEVENMRVGDRTDFNRLRISIETDGTISSRAALEQAIEIMITQLKAIVGFREEELPESSVAPMAELPTWAAKRVPRHSRPASRTSAFRPHYLGTREGKYPHRRRLGTQEGKRLA